MPTSESEPFDMAIILRSYLYNNAKVGHFIPPFFISVLPKVLKETRTEKKWRVCLIPK